MDMRVTLGEVGEVITSPDEAVTPERSGSMPKAANHIPPRSVRVPDHLWEAAKLVAELQRGTVTDVLVAALAQFVLDAMTEEGDGDLRPDDRELLRQFIPERELRRIITHIETSRPIVGA